MNFLKKITSSSKYYKTMTTIIEFKPWKLTKNKNEFFLVLTVFSV